jgi:DNA repair protein RadC
MSYHIPKFTTMLVREGATTTEERYATVPAQAAEIACAIIGPDADRECTVVLFLNTRHRVIGSQMISVGTLNASLVHPRETFKGAILAGAAAIVLAHNHPSGDATPSNDDVALTKRLRTAGEILGIPVLDHVVIGDGTYVSLRGCGLID